MAALAVSRGTPSILDDTPIGVNAAPRISPNDSRLVALSRVLCLSLGADVVKLNVNVNAVPGSATATATTANNFK